MKVTSRVLNGYSSKQTVAGQTARGYFSYRASIPYIYPRVIICAIKLDGVQFVHNRGTAPFIMTKGIQLIAAILLCGKIFAQPTDHDLHFDTLAPRWDEAIPLGNGMLGALVWQRAGNLRFSLDRADLWDQRPMKGLERPEFSYQWVIGQVRKKDYTPVQQY